MEWSHGGDLLSVTKETGRADLLDFSANINPLGQPESVQVAIANSGQASLCYPDPFCRQLKESIAIYEKVNKNFIVCGNGAAELIFKIAYALAPKKALVLAPTFSEYEQALKQVGAQVNYHWLKEEYDFQVKEDILSQVKGQNMVFLCTPNNPVGNITDFSLIVQLVKECQKQGVILVLDECFMDLAENPKSAKALLETYNKLIILKAFTKSFAIPGIRLGYCLCADRSITSLLEKIGPPWSVSVPAQLAGVAACEEKAFLKSTVCYIAKERAFLKAELTRLGLRVYPSKTNFLLFYSTTNTLYKDLLQRGIVIKDCKSYKGLKEGFYRIAVRTKRENKLLIEALGEVLCQRELCSF